MVGIHDRRPNVDTIVVGGGVAGAVIAARLAAGSTDRVLLLEAGPDYGRLSAGRWPRELLNYCGMPIESHSWGYRNAGRHGLPHLPLARARVIGGCSSHNGCAAIWGHRRDYDAWAAAGNEGWDAESLLPLFRRASEQLRVWTPRPHEITPWHRACLDAAPAAGVPFIAELNSLDAELGIGIGSLNVAAGVRWNSAFAYLDPVRGLPNLEILGDSLVDSIILEADRCVGVEVVERGRRTSIFGRRVVLAGGVYGSPLILLRSGIGPATELESARIACRHDLPGVGRNLQDHPVARLAFAGTDGLNKAMNEFVAAGGDPRQEGTIVLARSGYCHDAFDMHLYPLGTRTVDGWQFAILAAVMTPRSTGAIRVSSRDPESAPQIDHGYFTDDGDNDLSILAEGLELAREIAHRAPLTDLAGTEIAPLVKGTALTEHIRANAITDDHPVGSCKMGPASDPSAVVDERGRVHGIQGLFVGDAAIMPTIPRANTNIPTAVVGEKIAQLLLQN